MRVVESHFRALVEEEDRTVWEVVISLTGDSSEEILRKVSLESIKEKVETQKMYRRLAGN